MGDGVVVVDQDRNARVAEEREIGISLVLIAVVEDQVDFDSCAGRP